MPNRSLPAALALGLSLHAIAAPAQQAPARHPLDPLTREEIATTVAVLPGRGG